MGPGRSHSSFSIESIGCHCPGALGLKESRASEPLSFGNQFKGRCDLQQSVALKGDRKHCASGGPGRGNATAILLASGPEGVGHEQPGPGAGQQQRPTPKATAQHEHPFAPAPPSRKNQNLG